MRAHISSMQTYFMFDHLFQLFHALDICVVLVEVITWTVADQIPITTNPGNLLRNLEGYVEHHHDALMLLTYVCSNINALEVKWRQGIQIEPVNIVYSIPTSGW